MLLVRPRVRILHYMSKSLSPVIERREKVSFNSYGKPLGKQVATRVKRVRGRCLALAARAGKRKPRLTPRDGAIQKRRVLAGEKGGQAVVVVASMRCVRVSTTALKKHAVNRALLHRLRVVPAREGEVH